jgi:hypothetical protein
LSAAITSARQRALTGTIWIRPRAEHGVNAQEPPKPQAEAATTPPLAASHPAAILTSMPAIE